MNPENALKTLKSQQQFLIDDEKKNGHRSDMVFIGHANTVKDAIIALHDVIGWDAVHECTRYLKPQGIYQQSKGSAKIQTIGRLTVLNAINRYFWYVDQKQGQQ